MAKTIKLSTFLKYIKSGTVPPAPPNIGTTDWFNGAIQRLSYDELGNDFLNKWRARETCIQHGMWAIVEKGWTKKLAKWIGNRKVLEIMAGRGWLARALSEYGVEIIATDSGRWDDKHTAIENVFPVQRTDAVNAVREIDADVLLVSWSPYGDETITKACEAWGRGRPILYIGESTGGCNAPDSFFEHFKIDETAPEIVIPQWDGLHDRLMIGEWS